MGIQIVLTGLVYLLAQCLLSTLSKGKRTCNGPLLNVYLIRHAQSQDNLLNMSARFSMSEYNHILRHAHASPLTLEGDRQAQAIGKQLRSASVEKLYSSPYSRALTTAQVIGKQLVLVAQVCADLREVQPLALKESQRTAALHRHFVRSYLLMLWPWGREETVINAYRRAQRVWTWIEAEPAQCIALVSHGAFIRLLLLAALRRRHWRILQRDFSNGGISLLTRLCPK